MIRKRIEWIDLAKGMSIILVVYGHAGLSSIQYLGEWFSSFRMPFFFFVSGMLFSADKYPNFSSFIRRRWQTLIRPYFIFSFICMLAYCYIYPDDIRERLLHILLYGWGGQALWFIPVLTLTEILYFAIRKCCKNNYAVALSILCAAVIGRISSVMSFPNNYNLWFALTAVLFYGGGNMLNIRIIQSERKWDIHQIVLCAFVSLMFSLTYLLNVEKPEFFVNKLATPVTYVAAFGGTLFMCCIAMFLSRIQNSVISCCKRIVIFFGKNSYVVLAFHQVILLTLGRIHIVESGSVKRFTMWCILIVLIHLINKYMPFVLGRDTR